MDLYDHIIVREVCCDDKNNISNWVKDKVNRRTNVRKK